MKTDFTFINITKENLNSNIKNALEFVEAYANLNNQKSIGILEKFGLIKQGKSE